MKFQIKAQNNTGKFSLCFHVVNKMALGVLVAIGVVIAKLVFFNSEITFLAGDTNGTG